MLYLSHNPEILSLFGPFSVHAYGLFVGLGIAVFSLLTFNHPLRKKYISAALYERFTFFTIISACIGARAVHVISEWHSYHSFFEVIAIWNGGLSILGAVGAGLICIPLFLRAHHIPVLPILDLICLYLPLSQAIARLGCFFAGCCFGCQTNAPWAVVYTHSASHAPVGIALHPTQLYSVFIFVLIFAFLQVLSKRYSLKPGQITALYLILSSLERFGVDFFRGDRILNTSDALIQTTFFSMHQWISLGLIALGVIFLWAVSKKREVA